MSCRGRALAVAGGLMLALAGCPERLDKFENDVGLTGPYVVDGRAVYLSEGREAALILEPESSDFTVATLSGPPTDGVRVPGRPELAVLLSESEVLEILDVFTGAVTTFELGSPFDSLSLSDDGGFAITSFAGGGTGILSNAAEVAVVDLDAEASDTNPARRTIASAGGAPIGIDVSPPFGASGRRIALVRSVNHLAAIDLTQPTGATRSIPLVPPSQTTTVTPLQVEFAVRGARLEVFVRVSGLNDIYHLFFEDLETDGTNGAPLPVLNQFAAGTGPSDIAVWEGDTLNLLVVNSVSQDLTVVDVDSAQATTVPLNTQANRLLLYDGLNGREALAFTAGGGSKQFHRVALEDLAVKKSKAVTTRSLVTAIQSIEAVAGGDWFLVTHVGGAGAVTLVEGAGNAIMPFTGGGQVTGSVVSEDGAEIFVLTQNGAESHLSVIDIASGHPESMELEGQMSTGIHRLAGGDFVLMTHDDRFGALTLVRTSEIEEGESTTIDGFALSKIFDEEDVEK